jgi:hypothetical protein
MKKLHNHPQPVQGCLRCTAERLNQMLIWEPLLVRNACDPVTARASRVHGFLVRGPFLTAITRDGMISASEATFFRLGSDTPLDIHKMSSQQEDV